MLRLTAKASGSAAPPASSGSAPRRSDVHKGRRKPKRKDHHHHHHINAPSSSDEPATLTPHGLPPVQTTVSNHWIYLFFRFCAERHRMFNLREEGVPRDRLSDDETLSRTFVGNIFRELDGGSRRIREEVIGVGDQSHEEICFRIFLFCGFYNDSTWRELTAELGGPPSWKDFNLERYERILHQKSMVRKEKIYYGGFQIVPPTVYFGRRHPLPHYAATLRFVMSLMEMGVPDQLLQCRYASDASSMLQTVPTLGGFMSLNLLCYLNDSPHLHFFYRNFASCGPGSRSYLQRIFGGGENKTTINSIAMEEAGLRWLYENQWRYWARIGVDPPHAWQIGLRPGMRVLDMENSLCWCHRYVNDFQRKGYGNLSQIPHPSAYAYDPDVADAASAPAWCDERANVGSASKAAWLGDYDEEKERLASIATSVGDAERGEEDVYEVEKIVARKGSRADKDGLFRVRWKGYTPEEDTWERASSLKEGAEEALADWLEWEKRVWTTIDRIANDHPFQGPKEDIKQEPAEDGGGVNTTNKRNRRTRTDGLSRKRLDLKNEIKREEGGGVVVVQA